MVRLIKSCIAIARFANPAFIIMRNYFDPFSRYVDQIERMLIMIKLHGNRVQQVNSVLQYSAVYAENNEAEFAILVAMTDTYAMLKPS